MKSDVVEGATYYDVLGVSRDASLEDIKAAYRKAVLHLHPDKSHSGSSTLPADKSAFLTLHTAWQVLKDPDLRAAYNKQLDRAGHKVGVFISNEVYIRTQYMKTGLELHWKLLLEEIQVDLDDMEHLVAQDGSSRFSYPCRCGEAFVCAEEDLTETSDSLLVQCQGCSLIIRVLYTVADEA